VTEPRECGLQNQAGGGVVFCNKDSHDSGIG
jgi:hypothetical protein